MLANLLNNAAKYVPPGGRIELSVAREGGEAVVRVKDTGIGIAPEVLPHVFDLFVQSERALDRSQGGLGIGLTLVKRLVELHGGSITAHSDGPGRGSTFTVRLPAVIESPPSHESNAPTYLASAFALASTRSASFSSSCTAAAFASSSGPT